METKNYKIESRIWITTEEGTFLGEGRIALLREIDTHGSISQAAKAMKMSYKKAWELVNSMNKQGPELIVTQKTGGVGGGGSVLSETGKKAVKVFEKLKAEQTAYLSDKSDDLNFS